MLGEMVDLHVMVEKQLISTQNATARSVHGLLNKRQRRNSLG